MYEIPGGLDWVKANLYVANLNSPLNVQIKIKEF